LRDVLQIVNDARRIWADNPDLDAIEALDAVESKIIGSQNKSEKGDME
jgi:hypothetical protein